MAIVQALRELQTRYGYLPERQLELLALRLREPLYRVQEVASFFPSFRSEQSLADDYGNVQEPPAVSVLICRDMACHLRGSAKIVEGVQNEFQKAIAAGRLEVKAVSCLGRCDRATAACLHRFEATDQPDEDEHEIICGGLQATDGKAAPQQLSKAIGELLAGEPASHHEPTPAATANWKIDVYNPAEGEKPPPFAAVQRYLREKHDLIDFVGQAGLLGMGGALARAARKWGDVREAVTKARMQGKYLDCYVVCNGDESEPGTFKDRELLLRAPHLVVEGVLLAGLFLGAKKGIIYIRHEYGEPIKAVRGAIAKLYATVKEEAVQSFPIEVFVSPGGYICGEQSALLQAIEDRRAQPRNAPPAIEAIGLYEQPTVVNNVETLSWVPGIVLNWPKTTPKPPEPPKEGADAKKERKPNDEVWYARDKRRFFSISGDVKRPGVYEMRFKDTLRTLIFDKNCAQGMAEGRAFKAVATSGPSGGFLPPRIAGPALQAMRERIRLAIRNSRTPERLQKFLEEKLAPSVDSFFTFDLELDGSFLRDLGIGLGAGIVVYGDTPGKPTPMIEHALNCLHFFERESCGKCVPCRIGCQKLVNLGNKVRTAKNGQTRAAVEQVADELADLMKITSICSLGRSAAIPLTTCLDYFAD